jgi:hypothetical protein
VQNFAFPGGSYGSHSFGQFSQMPDVALRNINNYELVDVPALARVLHMID